MNLQLHRKFGLGWAEELECEKGVYVRRWRIETPFFSIRLHHWLHSDDNRSLHDHPWWFISFIFRGGYTDQGTEIRSIHRAPSLVYRSAQHKHWVEVHLDGCWSIILTGPKVRRWGFWLKNKFIVSYRYFYKYGKHICD
jgi:hypothetical protein